MIERQPALAWRPNIFIAHLFHIRSCGCIGGLLPKLLLPSCANENQVSLLIWKELSRQRASGLIGSPVLFDLMLLLLLKLVLLVLFGASTYEGILLADDASGDFAVDEVLVVFPDDIDNQFQIPSKW
jgi:hypothetical protein